MASTQTAGFRPAALPDRRKRPLAEISNRIAWTLSRWKEFRAAYFRAAAWRPLKVIDIIYIWEGDEAKGWGYDYPVEIPYHYANRFTAWLDGWDNLRQNVDGSWYSPYLQKSPVIVRLRQKLRRFLFIQARLQGRVRGTAAAVSNRIAWTISQVQYFREKCKKMAAEDRDFRESYLLKEYTGIHRVYRRLRRRVWSLRHNCKRFRYYLYREFHPYEYIDGGAYDWGDVGEWGYVIASFIHAVLIPASAEYDMFCEERREGKAG
jgi:hypothetical protein